MRELVVELALGLREHVLPFLGAHAGRAHVQAGAGGDVTFAIDSEAEQLPRALPGRAGARRRLLLGGPRTWSSPPAGSPDVGSCVVDPIDGTRPALAGFESSCVSVAAAPLGDGDPAMGDVDSACVAEIKSGALVRGRAGAGIELRGPDGGRPREPSP